MSKEILDERAIIVERLTKNFEVTLKERGVFGSIKSFIKPKKKIVKALRGISFSIKQGELVGFIGPNGAGKTTTLKILSGLLFPTSGFVQVLGYNPWDRNPQFLKEISVVFGQKNQLWWDLPAIETFELNRVIYEIAQKKYEERINFLTNLLSVKNLLNIPVRRLSFGQRMRLELMASLLHKPKVLFLDEPTIGLDLIAQKKIRDFIYEYNKREKATILLTSHNMDDLVDLARRVIVIEKGEIYFDGEIQGLVDKFAKEKIIKISLSKECDVKRFTQIGRLKKYEFPEAVLSVPREVSFMAASEILQNFPVSDLTIEEEPIEEIVRRVFRKEVLRKND